MHGPNYGPNGSHYPGYARNMDCSMRLSFHGLHTILAHSMTSLVMTPVPRSTYLISEINLSNITELQQTVFSDHLTQCILHIVDGIHDNIDLIYIVCRLCKHKLLNIDGRSIILLVPYSSPACRVYISIIIITRITSTQYRMSQLRIPSFPFQYTAVVDDVL